MSVPGARSLIEKFPRLRVLVIGDLMLDHYVWGSVSRISPEAPVPVVDVQRESEMPGGAGNVAVNLAALGAKARVVGLLGQDAAADRLLGLLRATPVDTQFIVRSPERPTVVKTRIIAQHQQVVRVDRERRGALPAALALELWKRIERAIVDADAVILSDYAKGVLSADLLKRLIAQAARRGLPVTVDPKVENFAWYRRVSCVTPNLKEAMEGGQVRSVPSEDDLVALGEKLRRRLDARSVLITRGEKGMSLFERGRPPLHIPTRAREVFDVTGAGDTVIGTLTLALAGGASLRTAAELANYAAGIVVAKIGTASATVPELLKVLRSARD